MQPLAARLALALAFWEHAPFFSGVVRPLLRPFCTATHLLLSSPCQLGNSPCKAHLVLFLYIVFLWLFCCCLHSRQSKASYLGEAVQNVVAHNFTGGETEPPTGSGAAGWQGDIHDRKKDG